MAFPDQEGIASGATNAISELGGFGIAVLGAVFSARGGYTSGASFVAGLSPAAWVGGAAVAAASAAALALPPLGKTSAATATETPGGRPPCNLVPSRPPGRNQSTDLPDCPIRGPRSPA